MLVLVVDSSTPAVTAALAEISTSGGGSGAAVPPTGSLPAGPAGVEILACRHTVDARAHGELLAPHIRAVLSEVGATPRDLGAIVAGLGPGPFTGLRVGLVTAAGMGQALGIPTYGVCSLHALGWAVASEPGRVLAASDARRREIYWGVYEGGRPITGPSVGSPASAAARAAELGAVVAVGDGALRHAEVLIGGCQPLTAVSEEPRYPPAEALAALAAERVRAGVPSERLNPLYLRRPDAVEPSARKTVLQ